jgi:hypothetical protein
LKAKYLEKY